MSESSSWKSFAFDYEGERIEMCGVPDEYVFERIGSSGTFYEIDLLEKIREALQQGDGLVVDVGANIGNHTVFFARTLGRKVVAIEPEEVNLEILRANIRANGLDDLVEVQANAAMSEAGAVHLTQRIEGNRGTFSATMAESGIDARTLDEMLDGRSVDLVKIDVEGAELEVLNGARKTLTENSPLVVVEAHTSEDRSELNAFFAELSFRPVAIAGVSDNYFWLPMAEGGMDAQQVWNRSLLENQRTGYRYVRDILAQVAACRQEIGELVTKIDLQAIGQGDASGHAYTTIGLMLTSIHQLLERDASPSSPLRLASASLNEEIDALSRLRRSLIEADDQREASLRRIAKESDRALEHIQRVVKRSVAASRRAESNLLESQNATERVMQELHESVNAKNAETSTLLAEVEQRIQAELRAVEGRIAGNLVEGVESGETHTLASLQFTVQDLLRRLVSLSDEVQNLRGDLSNTSEVIDASGRRLRSRAFEAQQGPANLEGSTKDATGDGLDRLLRAYAKLAYRLERSDPRAWSAETIIAVMGKNLALSRDYVSQLQREAVTSGRAESDSLDAAARMREIFPAPRLAAPARDRVRVGIASMPGREQGLSTVLRIIAPQADEVFVYLNGMDSVPETLPNRSNVRYFAGPDVGDRGKFAFMEGFRGYYITCDDDIEYASFHVQSIIDGVERYSRRAVVGWHGSNFKTDFKKFYDSNSRQVLSFRFLRGQDTPVHLLGTGVCGFHTDTLEISYQDFEKPNMADVFLALAAKRQGVPMVVLAHGKDWARPIDVGPSISTVSLKKDSAPSVKLDVAAAASELVLTNKPWRANRVEPAYVRQTFTVAFIGRTDRSRWKKGGILKSAHLTVDHLRRFGVDVILEDIVTGDPKTLSGRNADIVMLYVGDPDRPDFKSIEQLVGHHAKAGRKVIVNLSYNGKASRTEFIRRKIAEWRSAYGDSIYLMAFTEPLIEAEGLADLRDATVVIPKTLVFDDEPVASFASSDGIFVGDIAKLSDDYLLDYPAAEWIAKIREALPSVKLFGVRQYKPKYDVKLDIDVVWPFMTGADFVEKIGAMRLMVSMVKYATFEMVPVEVAALGVPVIYPGMPQSLSEHLGIGGVRVDSPGQLAKILPTVYNDPIVWRSFSDAGIRRSHSAELNNTAGQLYIRLLEILRGSR